MKCLATEPDESCYLASLDLFDLLTSAALLVPTMSESQQNPFYSFIDDVSKQTVSYWDTCRIAYNKIPNQTEFAEHFIVSLMQAAPARLGDNWIAVYRFVSSSTLSQISMQP